MLGIMAHYCMFPIMKSEPLAYLLYLMYFRSRNCKREITWENLGLNDENVAFVEAQLPQQAAAVTRTFSIAMLYMIFNILLTLFAVASLCKYSIHKVSFS
jgi:hypothetical protein